MGIDSRSQPHEYAEALACALATIYAAGLAGLIDRRQAREQIRSAIELFCPGHVADFDRKYGHLLQDREGGDNG